MKQQNLQTLHTAAYLSERSLWQDSMVLEFDMAATPIPSPPLSTSGIWSSRRICHQLTTSLPRYRLKTTSKRVKFQIPEIYVFFFALHMKGFASKCTELKVDSIGPGKQTAGMCVHFSAQKYLQAWAVKGLNKLKLKNSL